MNATWRLYLMEAVLLGMFMVSACTFGILLEHPASPIRQSIPNPLARRALIGIAMGITAVALIYSPIGLRSGAHMNPAVTLSFLRLKRIKPHAAAGYITAQFMGGAVATFIVSLTAGVWLRDPRVNVVATVPGIHGLVVAWLAEFLIAFVMMNVVLMINRNPRLARFTGVIAGLLVATYITFEAPLSGMSLNPARTFASAIVGQIWTAIWIYFTAPVAGMLSAVELQRALRGSAGGLCGKFSHSDRCVFKCACLASPQIQSNTP
jgi:aquaporin Z